MSPSDYYSRISSSLLIPHLNISFSLPFLSYEPQIKHIILGWLIAGTEGGDHVYDMSSSKITRNSIFFPASVKDAPINLQLQCLGCML